MPDFSRSQYLASFLQRMDQLNRDAHLVPEAYVEQHKDLVDPRYVDAEYEVDLQQAEVKGDDDPGVRRGKRHSQRSLSRLLRKGDLLRQAVVLGDPGSGKSVALRRLGCDLARAAAKDPRAPLPIYVPLGTYVQGAATGDDSVIELLTATLATCPADEKALGPGLLEALRGGRLAILFDSMDEMPRSDFVERFEVLRSFVHRYANAGSRRAIFVFACRTNDFLATQFKVQQIRLIPFRPRQVTRFLELYLSLPSATARAWSRKLLASDSPLAGVATNPLFLTLVAGYVTEHQRLPTTQAEIFRTFIEPRLRRHSGDAIGPVEVRGLLGMIALAMTRDAGVGTTLPISEALLRAGVDEERGNAALAVARRAGLVRIDDETGKFRFLHHRLQEFFSASALVAMPAEPQRDVLRAHVDDPWWDEIYYLAASMGADMAPLLDLVTRDAGATYGVDELEIQKHEARLILVGHVLDHVPNPDEAHVQSLASLHEARLAVASGRAPNGPPTGEGEASKPAPPPPLAELRRVRILRALRGPLLRVAALESHVKASVSSDSLWEQEEAFRAATAAGHASTEGRRDIVRQIYRDCVHFSFLSRYVSYRRVVLDDPRLAFLRPHVHAAGLLYFLLMFVVLGGPVAVGWFLGSPLVSLGAGGVVLLIAVLSAFQKRRRADPSGALAMLLRVVLNVGFDVATFFGLCVGTAYLSWRLSGDVDPSLHERLTDIVLSIDGWIALFFLAWGAFTGVLSILSTEAWKSLPTVTVAITRGIGQGVRGWAWFFLVLGALPYAGTIDWEAAQGLGRVAVILLLATFAIAFLARGSQALHEISVGLDRLSAWLKPGYDKIREMSVRDLAEAVGGSVVGLLGILAIIGVGAGFVYSLGWLIDSAVTPVDDRLEAGWSVIISLVVLAASVAGLIAAAIYLARLGREVMDQGRQEPGEDPKGTVVFWVVRRLASLVDNGLPSPVKIRAVRALAVVEPPTVTLIQALAVVSRDVDAGLLASATARTMDNLQARLRREARKDELERLRGELRMLAAIRRARASGDEHWDEIWERMAHRWATEPRTRECLARLAAEPAFEDVAGAMLDSIAAVLSRDPTPPTKEA